MTSQPRSITVGARFGPYRLDRLIGRGGMGEVYRAYDTVKDRVVALKVLPERLAHDPVYRQRFQRESHAAARLREAHVIPIHDYGEIDGHLYIDMRLVEGEDLRALLERAGPAAPDRAVGLVEQLASALDAAHAEGLLHRDVKPDNILIARDGFAYLVDFGLAQSSTDDQLTSDGTAVGSFRYMAPERFSARDFSPAADVYALTCVLFQCLTGAPPFHGDSNVQLMRAHLFDPVPRPSGLRPGVPEAFDAVVARGLAKNPHDRYQSAGELAAAARAALGGQSNPGVRNHHSGPWPTGATERLEPPATAPPAPPRRSRRRLAALLGVIALLAASTGFAGWAFWQGTGSGNAVADATALRGADIELLSMINNIGYKRANCAHLDPDSTTVAGFSCAPNGAVDTPLAQFIRFKSATALHNYYDQTVDSLKGTNCPGEAAGKDGPSLIGGKEVGRQSCYSDTTVYPDAPQPSLIITNEEKLVMAMYFWAGPGNTADRDFWAKYGVAQIGGNSADPDAFTATERDMITRSGGGFTTSVCRHFEPGIGFQGSAVRCSGPRGTPTASLFGYSDAATATSNYQADLSRSAGRACGGSGSDSEWKKGSSTVGRYFCFTYTDNSNAKAPVSISCLMAVRTEARMEIQVCGSSADDPTKAPVGDAQLLAWFHNRFG
ncbi:serine/threonine-protein kinase [Nocardia yamanashiensis]|uniref:serine/threonine-protein kinase n=1 Tax=Nocardia yamanashiensis TaxID=209247 RepID=UPI0022B8158F|nr:serine/threonine-protein kinase [Nocardia yamanashiensis]